jgi:hypothetical protein
VEEYAADFLTKGIATTQTFNGKVFDIAGGDGKALFATDHAYSKGSSSTFSNLFNAEFTYENLTYIEALASDIRDSIGRKINFKYDTIIVPYSNKYDALQLQKIFETLSANGNPNTADNAGNYHAGRWNIIWWNFLGSPSGMTAQKSWWMLADSNYIKKYKPFVMQKRKDLTVTSYVDNNTDANIWKGRARMKISPTNSSRGIIACIPGLGTTV